MEFKIEEERTSSIVLSYVHPLEYRLEKYKTKMCANLLNPGDCEMGKFCPFAHEESELQGELIHNLEFDEDFYLFHFKTVWCPWV
jgi:hypothetical protein